MESVLNKGLKFAILPPNLDVTQALTDFRRFERTMVWKEFWFGRDNVESQKTPIFKQKKHNFPNNYKSPQDLQNYLASVKSEILDPKNHDKVNCNLPLEEKGALKMLIQYLKGRKNNNCEIKKR